MCRHTDDPEVIATTSGRAIPDVEVRIVDPDGEETPRGEPGEIVVRGYNVMVGYLDDPEKTAETIFYFPGLIVFFYMTFGFVVESIQRGERGMDTTWMPYMWPIKTCLLIGIIFLLIQGFSELLKSYWAAKRGEWPGEDK